MRIERIDVQAYRSLYDVSLHLPGFAVVVGPNNSGKSNLSDSFAFLADVYRYGLASAIQRRGGLDNIAHRRVRRSRRDVHFTVVATLSNRDVQGAVQRRPVGRRPRLANRFRIEHQFGVAASTRRLGTSYQVSHERLTITMLEKKDQEATLVEVARAPGTLTIAPAAPDSISTDNPYVRAAVEPFNNPSFVELLQSISDDDLLFPMLRVNNLIWAFASNMGRNKIFQLVPNECRKPGAMSPQPELGRNGDNLPAVVNDMKEREPQSWDSVMTAMTRVVSDLTNVEVDFPTLSQLTLKFYERGVGRPWLATEVSDGTIHSLALFVALHDRRTPVLIVEEPENSVHPWILRVFLDQCREAAQYKQILLTTHSPAVLSYLKPSEVIVVWKDHGRTALSPLVDLDEEVEGDWSEGLGSVFDYLDSGRIAVAVPPGPTDLTEGIE